MPLHPRLIFSIFLIGTVVVYLSAVLVTGMTAAEPFVVGERLTYNISFGQIDNAAYAELYTASRGKLGGKDAIEFRSKLKTFGLVGAAFYSINEARTTFASPDSLYPLYISKIEKNSLEPKETVANYLNSPSSSYDLLTVIAKAREAGGAGTFTFSEDEKLYNAVFVQIGTEKIKTEAGEFDTTLSTVESEFLTGLGITELKINFTLDELKVPALIRFKIKKTGFRASLAGREVIEPDVEATPSPSTTPVVVRTPQPAATPTPYIADQPLSPELPFSLGETLDYNLSNNGQTIGRVEFAVKERKLFGDDDSVLLAATVKDASPAGNLLDRRDTVTTQVDPDSLAPLQFDMRFAGGLAPISQSLKFDQQSGTVTVGTVKKIDVPVGTHNLLSFLYAMRTIRLKPSKDPNNPVNDTRIAVFWDTKAYIFTLRPSMAEFVDPTGKKISCILVAVSTGNPQLDQLGIKVWLADDVGRLPLRISIGPYQADLVRQ